MLPLVLALALTATPTTKPATNTFCPVMGCKVDAQCPEVLVHGRKYRVCCMDCASKLKANPAKYLKTDGTPKNATLAAAVAAVAAANHLCPVMGVQVDANSPVVVVRGREYRVCCMDCAAKLRAHPAQYLTADGTPKNEK